MTVRTRVAPSPTGDPHVGTAYIALFNLCFARQHGGQFILRIEDTDQVRSTRESEQMILDSLRWLGLNWDEGPDVGGPHGPYRQSERAALYQEHAQILLDNGSAFRCFCTAERLDALRAEQTDAGGHVGYDGHCIGLSPDEVQAKLDADEPHVVRLKVPRDGGVCAISDLLRGTIEIDWAQVDMQVLLKSDGLPTYHLANVVDDHHMRITHVMRGEEWINSAPKHLLLYQAFGWEPPVLCHLPLLRNPDKSKLSKRKNPTSLLYYERMGYLPEALVNYLGMMGWSMPDGQEKFTLDAMIEAFDLTRISLGGPVFDLAKLAWLNGRWIREDLSPEDFVARVQRWAFSPARVQALAPLVQPRVERLSDLAPLAAFFFAGHLTDVGKGGLQQLTPEAFDVKQLDRESALEALTWGQWRLDDLDAWDAATIDEAMRDTAERKGAKLRLFLKPFFIALSGSEVSTPLFDTMAVLGRDVTRSRLRDAVELLGGVGKKKLKKWRKDYDQAHSPS